MPGHDVMEPDDPQRNEALAAYLDAAAAGRPAELPPQLEANPDLTSFRDQHERLAELGSWWRQVSGEGQQATQRIEATQRGDETTPLWSPPPRPDLPGYEIVREIARGGMGVVYEAKQESLGRTVAVKLILHGALAGEAERRRFLAEAAAAAKLKHPSIVVIHEVGEHNRQLYFSMEYVAGESLSQRLRRMPPSPQQSALIVSEVARAVHFAHQRGVLHRDIKPSNVLIGDTGRVRVMDFGLAKQIDADDKLTMTGQLMGTPSYMAPEQISSAVGPLGPACDVYGLGALLYALLTGQAPFAGGNQMETLLSALELQPALPRRANPAVPRPLEMIVMKCLEKNPADRYATAQALAGDLERFLMGESLSISSPNLLDRVVRNLERSQFDREIHTWSHMLRHVAWIALISHSLVSFNAIAQSANAMFNLGLIRATGFSAMLAVFWLRRADWYPPRGAAARQLGAIWLGYLAGSAALVTIDYLQTPPGAYYAGLGAYPHMAVLASLAFILLGSSYWGYCYAIGALFLAVALAITQAPVAGPLVFGICW
ncbi:MAG TPA: serine/threonine-protein kinase, partial [Lacipirellulaceae bacterium]|nr:serine/threonine-protein kinase [Lacipirellulaceae bacterium]